jgi:phosphatidylglycerol:prolipoprotein diacylglycerol transferase
LEVTDIVAPHLALGIALARVGCFFNGCCFGKASDLPWACVFPVDSQAGWIQRSMLAGRAVQPTQIYEAIACAVMFFFLRKLLRRGYPAGTVFFSFLTLYGLWRFGIDYLRYYEVGMYLEPVHITWNQVVSLAMIASGLVFLVRSVGRSRKHDGR